MAESAPINILFILGTRPEAIKCAPVILQAQRDDQLTPSVAATSQHRELQNQVLHYFGIKPDVDLNLMRQHSDLAHLVREAWTQLMAYINQNPPDMIAVQGDTTTAFIAALTAAYSKVPIAHIEAGLRTYDKSQPFPEEINRRLISHVADLHFAPTESAKQHLLREGLAEPYIHIVGNPGIDALLYAIEHQNDEDQTQLRRQIPEGKRLILVTCHRRENWGENLDNLCHALKTLVTKHTECTLLFIMHPNPTVTKAVERHLSGDENIQLRSAVGYQEMAFLLNEAYLILTDSGGIQEEAPVLGKPVLVLRDTSERMEVIDQQGGILVGTNAERIMQWAGHLLEDESLYAQYAQPSTPFGDGKAAERICEGIKWYFGLAEPPSPFIAKSHV